MLGYKFFFKKGIVYKLLNPSNVIKVDKKFKLVIPTTIFQELKELNEIDVNEEIFYFSPE